MTNYIEFSAKIKEKYPQYADVDDRVLAEKMIEKYPEYKETVTFEEKEEPKKAGLFDKVNAKDYYVDELAKRHEWEENHPIISNIQKDFQPGYRAQQKEMELRSKYGYNAPIGEELKTILSEFGQNLIPAVNIATGTATGGMSNAAKTLLSQLGRGAAQGAIQGGVLGLSHDLGDNGINLGNITEAAKGAGIGSLIGGLLPLGIAGGEKLANKGGELLKRGVGKLAQISPETVEQVIKPTSKALDYTREKAQDVLRGTTERVRDAYNNLLKGKGEAISAAEENLRNVSDRVNIGDILRDIKGTFDQYQGENINAARNLTGNLEGGLNELVESGTVPLEQVEANISKSVKPQTYLKDKENEAFDILSKATGKSKKWLRSQLNSDNFKGGTGKRKEFIDNLLDKVDDKLDLAKDSATGYNDYKYYNNSNLGYANADDAAAGEQLARQAYDDIVNKRFYNTSYDPLSRDIQGAEQSYRILLEDLAKNSRSENAVNTAMNRFDNIVKNLPEEVQMDFAEKFTGDVDKILQDRNTLSAIDLQKIKQQIGQMTNWADTTRPKIQNTVLEQIYGKMRNRLEDLSPELAQANKDFAALKGFQEDEGLKTILAPGGAIDKASTALKNYNSTVSKGNTAQNIQALENILVKNGEQPFLNTMDDINAAMDLLKQERTGLGSLAELGKSIVTRPALKLARKYNASSIPNKVYNLKTALKGLAIPLMYRPQLQGSVEYNDIED